MELSNAQRAAVLVHALPYIQRYAGKTVVIKYGGNAMTHENLKQAVMGDIVLLSMIGVKVVLVHGGGPEISAQLKLMDKKSEFVDGLRVTDAETAAAVQMVLAGKVGKSLVNLIQCKGGRAIGMCGIDGHMIEAQPLDERLGFVGRITRVDPAPILDVLEKGYIPVISTVGCDADGNVYNINADPVAAAVAGCLKAESLLSLTDTAGLLKDPSDPATLMSKVYVSDIGNLVRAGIITGGMIPKIECCAESIRRGVHRVFIVDGRVPHSILIELLTDEGIGTMFAAVDEEV